jgi:cytochrome c biogenesis factor
VETPSTVQFNQNNAVHKKVAKTQLKNVQSKFVATINNKKTKTFALLAQKFGKPFVVFGSHKDYTPLQEQEEIAFLAWQKSLVPLKLVLVPDGRIFTLNTHRSLAYMMRFGQNVRIGQVPFVLFDFSNFAHPQIVDVNGSVTAVKNLQNLYQSALDLTDRVQNGWRPKNMSYTLQDLHNQLIELASQELTFE